jgi:plasmid stabilization system protein ParE
VKVLLSEEAQRQARRIRQWWRRNRTKAPNRFQEELHNAKRRLAVAAHEGQAYGRFDGELVRRVLLD